MHYYNLEDDNGNKIILSNEEEYSESEFHDLVQKAKTTIANNECFMNMSRQALINGELETFLLNLIVKILDLDYNFERV